MTTAPGSGRREAAIVVETALLAVFDPAVVRQLRPDSPLDALPLTDADAVAVADAIAAAAGAQGWDCSLGDDDLRTVGTVADLVAAVLSRATVAADGEAR